MRQFSIFMRKRRKQSLTVCSSFITCPAHWVVHWLWAIKQQNLSMVARLKSALVTVTCSSLSAKLSKNTITRYEFLYVTGFFVNPIQMSCLTNDRFTIFLNKNQWSITSDTTERPVLRGFAVIFTWGQRCTERRKQWWTSCLWVRFQTDWDVALPLDYILWWSQLTPVLRSLMPHLYTTILEKIVFSYEGPTDAKLCILKSCSNGEIDRTFLLFSGTCLSLPSHPPTLPPPAPFKTNDEI